MRTDLNSSANQSLTHTPSSSCFVIFIDDVVQNGHGITLLTLYPVIAVFIIIANVSMIFGLYKTNKKFTLSKKLFFYLSIVDLSNGSLTGPYQAFMVAMGTDASCTMLSIQAFLNSFIPALSMLLLLMISFYRYALISKSVSSTEFLTPKFVSITFVVLTTSCLCYSCWYVMVSQTKDIVHHAWFLIFTSAMCFCAQSGILTINIHLLRFINKRNKQSTVGHKKSVNLYHKRVTTTVFIISIAFVICYTPIIVCFALTGGLLLGNDHRRKYYHYLIPWTHLPVVINSGLNSIIYLSRSTSIKKYYKKLLKESSTREEKCDVLRIHGEENFSPRTHVHKFKRDVLHAEISDSSALCRLSTI